MEVNLKDIDDDLKDIKVDKKPANESDNSSPEDDVAIAEAIAQVEKELQKEKTAENSIWYLGLIVVGGLVTSRISLSISMNAQSLVVGDALMDDNSVVTLSSAKMEELHLFRGDSVLLKGNEGKDTVCIVLSSDEVDVGSIRMNETVRKNLKVNLGDTVTVTFQNIPMCKIVYFLPLSDTIDGVSDNLVDEYLKPYFVDAYRPLRKGDLFLVRKDMHSVEFQVVEMSPTPYGICAPDTEIHCKGNPLKREDMEKAGGLRKNSPSSSTEGL